MFRQFKTKQQKKTHQHICEVVLKECIAEKETFITLLKLMMIVKQEVMLYKLFYMLHYIHIYILLSKTKANVIENFFSIFLSS